MLYCQCQKLSNWERRSSLSIVSNAADKFKSNRLQISCPTSHPCKPDRKWNRSKHTSLLLKIPTTHSMKLWKTQRDADWGWDGPTLGWVKHRTQYCKYASWQSSSKPRRETDTQTDSGISLRCSCQKTWESTVKNSQHAKQSQRSSILFKKTVNHKTSLMAQSPKAGQGGVSPSSKVWPPSMKTVRPVWLQPPAWQWRWKQPPMLDRLKRRQSDHTCRHPHRFNGLATKSEKWNGKPRLECVIGQHQLQKLLRVYCPGNPEVQENDGADWQAKQPSQAACFPEDVKCWAAWDAACRHKAKTITPLITWHGERKR